jgi:hypothetical protein
VAPEALKRYGRTAHVTSVATKEEAAAVLVGEYEEALCQVPALIFNVNEVGESDVVVKLDGEMDDAIKYVAKGAVLATADWTTLPNCAMWSSMRSVARVQSDMRAQDRESTGDHLYTRNPSAAVQGTPTCSFARVARQSPSVDAQELGGGHHEDIGDISMVNTEILKKEGVALLLGRIWVGCMQVTEDSVALEVSNMMKWGGTCRGRPNCCSNYPGIVEHISVAHAGYQTVKSQQGGFTQPPCTQTDGV